MAPLSQHDTFLCDSGEDRVEEKPAPEQNETNAAIGTEPSSAEPAPAPLAESPAIEVPASTWRPADYYANNPKGASRFPRWVPLSCGIASIVFLVFLFLTGSLLLGGGLRKLVALAFGEVQSESEKLYAADVPPASRAALKAGLLSLRDRLADGKVALGDVLPLLQQLQSAIGDGQLTADEVERLTKAIESTESSAKPPAAPPDPPSVDL